MQKKEPENEAQKIFKKVAEEFDTYYDPDFPVSQLIQPKENDPVTKRGTVRSRDLDRKAVDEVKESIRVLGALKANPLHAVLFKNECTPAQRQLIDSENLHQVMRAINDPRNDFKLQVIAGAHRTAALQELIKEHAGNNQKIKEYSTWPVKVIVVPEQTPAISAMLNDYGVKENIVSSKHKQLTKTDIVANMRAAFKDENVIADTCEEYDAQPTMYTNRDPGYYGDFKRRMVDRFKAQFANDERKWDAQTIDPFFQLSRYPQDLFSLCMSLVSEQEEKKQETMVQAMSVLQGINQFAVRLQLVEDFVNDPDKPKNPATFRNSVKRAKFIYQVQMATLHHVNDYYRQNNIELHDVKTLKELRERYPDKFSPAVFGDIEDTPAGQAAWFTTVTEEILDKIHKVSLRNKTLLNSIRFIIVLMFSLLLCELGDSY